MDSRTTSPEPKARIRDLAEAEFYETYGCDRFTSSVLLNRLRYAVDHMATGFLREAFSPIIRDWYDFACTISGPPELAYPMSVVSNSLLGFLGTMPDGVANTVDEFGPANLCPGDVLIANDPYRSGTHVNDICFIRPVFSSNRLVSLVSIRAHQIDMGGSVPGGFSATKTNVYENGLVLPPLLLWRADKPVRSIFSLIFDNARFGTLLMPDFLSIFQQLRLGERLVHENIKRYGLKPYLGTLRYACDISAERMQDAILMLPNGEYVGEALVDADGIDDRFEYKIRVTLRKFGKYIEADLSGTSSQARTCINSTVLDAKTNLGVALTMLLDPTIPFTSGTWRNVSLAAPPGTILTALPPEGPTMMYWESSGAVLTAVFAALNPVLGANGVGGDFGSGSIHNASGVRGDGTMWANVCQVGGEHGPWGASRAGDGDSYTVRFADNNLDPATEQIEHDTPVVVLRKEHVVDTGGPGVHRGGAAHRKDTLFLSGAIHYSSPFRFKVPSGVGANGGDAGTTGAVWLFPAEGDDLRGDLVGTYPSAYLDSVPVAGILDPDTKTLDSLHGKYHYFAKQQIWKTDAGAIFRYQTNGGGGWGAPRDRDPAKVLVDVRDEYVSIEAAARDYGVVIVGDPASDPEGLSIDEEATARLRASA